MTRVLRIPGAHPYVDRCLAAVDAEPCGSPTGIPSPAFDLDWLARHHDEFDSVHLHFGFEHLSVDALRAWLAALAGHGLPLVYTVHDLRNPHQLTREHHDHQLDVLIPSAAAVLTLTEGAAAEIGRRWGRDAEVVPHPYVIPPEGRPRRTSPGLRVGMHLKDLRRNVIEPDRVVAAVAQGAAAVGGRLRVDLHPGAARHPELSGTRALAEQGRIDLSVHERFTDDELAAYLAGLDVLVLPYRFGTHSGWLEAARDVGTRVVAPSCGYYPDQWAAVTTYQGDETSGLNDDDLSLAVTLALLQPAVGPADGAGRERQLREVQDRHARLHRQLAGELKAVS